MNPFNIIATLFCVAAAVRALQLFHCRLGLAGRIAIAAFGFFAFAGVASGEASQMRGVEAGFHVSLGALAAVLLWQTRALRPTCVDSLPLGVMKGLTLLIFAAVAVFFTGCGSTLELAGDFGKDGRFTGGHVGISKPLGAKPVAQSVVASTPKPGTRAVQNSGHFAGKPYQATQKEYAQRYGVSLATVKRWWANGLPLDDAAAMAKLVSPNPPAAK